jgi:hypothetical protein
MNYVVLLLATLSCGMSLHAANPQPQIADFQRQLMIARAIRTVNQQLIDHQDELPPDQRRNADDIARIKTNIYKQNDQIRQMEEQLRELQDNNN